MAKAGKIRVLAVIGEGPSPILPGVPSFKEAGIGLQIGNWTGFFAPAGFPGAVIQRIHAVLLKHSAGVIAKAVDGFHAIDTSLSKGANLGQQRMAARPRLWPSSCRP